MDRTQIDSGNDFVKSIHDERYYPIHEEFVISSKEEEELMLGMAGHHWNATEYYGERYYQNPPNLWMEKISLQKLHNLFYLVKKPDLHAPKLRKVYEYLLRTRAELTELLNESGGISTTFSEKQAHTLEHLASNYGLENMHFDKREYDISGEDYIQTLFPELINEDIEALCDLSKCTILNKVEYELEKRFGGSEYHEEYEALSREVLVRVLYTFYNFFLFRDHLGKFFEYITFLERQRERFSFLFAEGNSTS